MVAIAAAVLVTFIGGLYFITHHKKEESTDKGHKNGGSNSDHSGRNRRQISLLFP
jgi:cell division protein FtsN